MHLRMFTCIALLCAAVNAPAQNPAEAQKLFGTWGVQEGTGGTGTTNWTFEEKGDSMKVVRMEGSEKAAEFECNTMGKDCNFKDAGKKAKVSMWFLGPKLVQLETKGNEVVKRRFFVNEQGDAMQVELIPISPAGKPETVTFKRVQVAAHK